MKAFFKSSQRALNILGFVALAAIWSAPALAGSVSIVTTTLPRDPNATDFPLDVKINDITDAQKIAAVDAKTDIGILLNKETSNYLPHLDTNDVSAKAYFSEDSQREEEQNSTTGNWTLTYHLRITVNTQLNNSITQLLQTGGVLYIDVHFAKDVAKTTAPAELKRGIFVANAAPTFSGEEAAGGQQSIFVTWDKVATIPTQGIKTTGSTATSTLNIFAIKKSVGSLALPAKYFDSESETTTDDADAKCSVDLSAAPGACACDAADSIYLDISGSKAMIENNDYGKVITAAVSAGGATIKGLENDEEYVLFMQYQPDSIKRSSCVVGKPEDNSTLTEANGEGKALPTDFRCFIATAAYGTPLHHDIDLFRTFRDRVLMRTVLGQEFVSLYYKYSPPMADFIAAHPRLRAATRYALEVPATVLSWFYE